MSAASKKFDLAAQLAALSANVPNSGTGKMQVEYIDIDRIDPDPENFYSLRGIEELAADIETVGLQQPLLVRPGEGDHVVIVSGHRRHAALRLLVDDGREDLREVPCIRQQGADSAALRGLQLVYANAHTRTLNSAEISRQAELTEQYLYQLKEEGFEFPGRMRDHVAEVVGAAKSKLARLKVIREGLAPDIREAYWCGDAAVDLTESAALAMARLPRNVQRQAVDAYRAQNTAQKGLRYLQARSLEKIAEAVARIEALQCTAGGGNCGHAGRMIAHAVEALIRDSWAYAPCGTVCCGGCGNLADCRDVCPELAALAREKKEAVRAANRAAKLEREAQERPEVERIEAIWQRFGALREKAGLTLAEYEQRIDCRNAAWDAKAERLEHGAAKVNPQTTLPYGYGVYLSGINRWLAAADALGCTVDYLMCRPGAAESGAAALPECQVALAAWMPGVMVPPEPCDAVADLRLAGNAVHRRLLRWDGGAWLTYWSAEEIEVEVIRWLRLPEVEEDNNDRG